MTNQNSETEITMNLLNKVEQDSTVTQRAVAKDLGIALGLVNSYLKKCMKKGLIKAKHVPANRYSYYVTPKGFREKSRLTAEFLSQSLNFFRLARNEICETLEHCRKNNWLNIVLLGKSELAEIIILSASQYKVVLTELVDAEAYKTTDSFMDLPVVKSVEDAVSADAYIITDIRDPQGAYNAVEALIPPDKLLTLQMLNIHRNAIDPVEGGQSS